MKKVSLKELVKYLSDQAREDYGIWFSSEVEDWIDDIRVAEANASEEYDGNNIIRNCTLEISMNKKVKLYSFRTIERYSEEDNYIETEYYV